MYNCYIAIHISAFCIFYICHFSTRIKTELKLNWHSLRLSFCKTPKISFWMTNFKYLHFYIILHYYSNITLATTLFMRLHCFCNSDKNKVQKIPVTLLSFKRFCYFFPPLYTLFYTLYSLHIFSLHNLFFITNTNLNYNLIVDQITTFQARFLIIIFIQLFVCFF